MYQFHGNKNCSKSGLAASWVMCLAALVLPVAAQDFNQFSGALKASRAVETQRSSASSLAVGAEQLAGVINPGLNGAWFNSETAGQGILLEILPSSDRAFFAWFTYDTEAPSAAATAEVGSPEHRWLTGVGTIDRTNSSIVFDINLTTDGRFNSEVPVVTSAPNTYGTLVMSFASCASAEASYDLTEVDLSGTFPLIRVASDNVALCEELETLTAQRGSN